MKYKIGNTVCIKSMSDIGRIIDSKGCVGGLPFKVAMNNYCSSRMTIDQIDDINGYYRMKEDPRYFYNDEMIEGLVEEETKPKYEDEVNEEYYSTIKYLVRPSGYQFVDENGNVINATKIVLEKKPSKNDDIIKWLRECDMTKYIGVIYSGMCSITFDTEGLIKDFLKTVEDDE